MATTACCGGGATTETTVIERTVTEKVEVPAKGGEESAAASEESQQPERIIHLEHFDFNALTLGLLSVKICQPARCFEYLFTVSVILFDPLPGAIDDVEAHSTESQVFHQNRTDQSLLPFKSELRRKELRDVVIRLWALLLGQQHDREATAVAYHHFVIRVVHRGAFVDIDRHLQL